MDRENQILSAWPTQPTVTAYESCQLRVERKRNRESHKDTQQRQGQFCLISDHYQLLSLHSPNSRAESLTRQRPLRPTTQAARHYLPRFWTNASLRAFSSVLTAQRHNAGEERTHIISPTPEWSNAVQYSNFAKKRKNNSFYKDYDFHIYEESKLCQRCKVWGILFAFAVLTVFHTLLISNPRFWIWLRMVIRVCVRTASMLKSDLSAYSTEFSGPVFYTWQEKAFSRDLASTEVISSESRGDFSSLGQLHTSITNMVATACYTLISVLFDNQSMN